MKKKFTPEQKATIALAAIVKEKTPSQICSEYEVHGTQVGLWKKQALQGMKDLFTDKRKKEDNSHELLLKELYETIGKRDMELAWLKKKADPFATP
jgi:transposase-like protein